MFVFIPKTRNYEEYKIINNTDKSDTDSNEHICVNFNPLEKKMYPDDIIDKTGVVIESPYLSKRDIPGILVTTGKTYGRVNNKGNNSRYYYKCIPNDKRLPCVLIPYQEKNPGFSKHKINLFVLFRLNAWTDKHPTGILNNVIGRVNDRINYCEYELHRKNLAISLKNFTKAADKAINKLNEICQIETQDKSLEDRRDRHIFSIDPPETRDIDDAMGIITPRTIPASATERTTISIYIANVPYWLSRLDLWEFITRRPSTVYLPHTNINMLPKKLSEDLISLVENKDRVAFVMDIDINTTDSTVTNISFTTAKINVTKNFSYEHNQLLKRPDYKDILKITKGLHQKAHHQKQYKYVEKIRDSHDVVEYYMIMMNHMSAKKLYDYKCGVFRTVITNTNIDADNIVDKELAKFINFWKYTSSAYSLYNEHTGHDIVAGGIDKYAQITSPIRRLCDIVNITELQIHIGKLVETENMRQTIDKITNDIDNVNVLSKNIRKVQSSSKLLNYCLDIERENNIVEGYIIDMTDKTKYNVYIPSLQLITKVKPVLEYKREYTLYKKCQFGLYVFTDEHSFHQKIRLDIK